eukprot:8180446-Alexandrium_andersonii.AAC.1
MLTKIVAQWLGRALAQAEPWLGEDPRKAGSGTPGSQPDEASEQMGVDQLVPTSTGSLRPPVEGSGAQASAGDIPCSLPGEVAERPVAAAPA